VQKKTMLAGMMALTFIGSLSGAAFAAQQDTFKLAEYTGPAKR
jgi:hypothetical protein